MSRLSVRSLPTTPSVAKKVESKEPVDSEIEIVALPKPLASPGTILVTAAPEKSRAGKRGRKGGGQAGSGPLLRGSGLPPVVELTPYVMSERKRFVVTAGQAYSISMLELVGTLGGICTVANSTIQHWCSSFRMRALELYIPAASAGSSPVNAGLEWAVAFTSFLPDTAKMAHNPGGVTAPNSLRYLPPKASLAGDWVNVGGSLASSTTLFVITNVPQGTVIDIIIDWTLGLVVSTSSSLLNSTVATGALGNVYYLGLDGPASNKILPSVGVPTTH